MPYKLLYLDLQQTAVLASAISFWAREQVKDRASNFFKSCHKFEYSQEVEKEWRKLTEIMIDGWNKDILPQTLEAKLIHVVKMIGKTIFSWCMYLKHEFGAENEATNDLDEIQWTPHGTIDEVRTLESLWLKNVDLDITKIYNIICNHALGDYINDLWNKVPSDQRNNYSDDIYKYFDKHIFAYWKHCRNGDPQNLMIYLEAFVNNWDAKYRRKFYIIYDPDRSTEENMLRLSVYEGYNTAVQYFWEKLTTEKKNQNVLKCARIAVLRNHDYTKKQKNIKHYKKSQYAEICLLLLNHMSRRDRKAFFNETLELDDFYRLTNVDVKDEILKMLLFLWPWEELFMRVLNDMIQYQDNDNSMACEFLDQITYERYINYSSDYARPSYAMLLLHDAWKIIPDFIKPKIICHNRQYGLISNLVLSRDLDNLKLILNDSAIKTVKNTFINYGSFAYRELVQSDDFEFLDTFIHEILVSEKEIKQFKQEINAWNGLITNNKFHLADKLLKWQSSTFEERQSIKNGLNSMDIIQDIIDSKDYELANKFLDWRYNTEEEKMKCKDDLKNDILSIMHVYFIWTTSNKDINEAKEQSLKFFQWFLKSEEEIVLLKKRIFINFENNMCIMWRLAELHCDHMIDDFISWCLVNDQQQIQHIKQSVSEFNNRTT